jgi:hypothetical protein
MYVLASSAAAAPFVPKRERVTTSGAGIPSVRRRQAEAVAVPGPTVVKHIRTDSAPYLPIEGDEGRVDGLGYSRAGRFDQFTEVRNELGRDLTLRRRLLRKVVALRSFLRHA